VTSHGWRPISVTIQPASVATQPMKVAPAKVHSNQRGAATPRRVIQAPNHASASIAKPSPTMMRKAKNTGATGGTSAPKSSSPCSSPSGSWRRIRLAPPGIESAQSLWRVFSFGIANSSSGTPLPPCQMASIAAILAGWCSSVFRPCWSPAKICSGASSAAIAIPVRSVRAAAASADTLSRRQADSPATTNAAVSPEASSMCAKR